MSHARTILALILTLAATLALPAMAEHHEGEKPEMPELSGYLADFEGDFEFSSGRLNQLADAFPAEKYGWSPDEGIRTVSQVFIHVAGANYFFANQFGVDLPEGFGMDAEQKITAKDDVIATLKQSQKHIHKAIMNAAEKDLDEKVMMFGRDRSWRSVLMIVSGHAHEHLGQAIAYARSNDVVPPWSQPQPPAAEEGEEGGEG
ncbi:MAG: DinB family protein [Thermoanaerobaculia bacterium]